MRNHREKFIGIGFVMIFACLTLGQDVHAARLSREDQERYGIKKEDYSEYRLGIDDVVDIVVRRQPEFTGRFAVDPEGKIQYPFVGEIMVEGMTKSEAVEAIRAALVLFVEMPEVYITIVEYNSKHVYVIGSVSRPGKYPMRSEVMPVRDAVLAAGLPREHISALRRTLIVRPLEDGRVIHKRINLLSLLYEGNMKLNYDLRPGDTVYVPSTVAFKVSAVIKEIISPMYQSAYVYQRVKDLRED